MTQAKIAREVGVSQTAVSLVLSGREMSISEEGKRLILAKAKELGYFTKILAPKKNGTICYLISKDVFLGKPFFHRFFVGIEMGAARFNRHVLVSTFDPKNSPLEKLFPKVDGFIIQEPIPEIYLERIAHSLPLVLFNWHLPIDRFDSVMPDNYDGIRKAVRYLYKLGHRKIGFFGAQLSRLHFLERYQGYRQSLEELGLPINEEYMFVPESREITDKRIDRFACQLLSKLSNLTEIPTALICCADTFALSILRLAPKFGFRIPEDFSVVGFDYIEECLQVSPTLSSIDQPIEEMGKEAVDMLLERIENPDVPPRKNLFGLELKVLQSIGKPQKGGIKQKERMRNP